MVFLLIGSDVGFWSVGKKENLMAEICVCVFDWGGVPRDGGTMLPGLLSSGPAGVAATLPQLLQAFKLFCGNEMNFWVGFLTTLSESGGCV